MPQDVPIELEEISISSLGLALHAVTVKFKSGVTKTFTFGASLDNDSV